MARPTATGRPRGRRDELVAAMRGVLDDLLTDPVINEMAAADEPPTS